LKPSKSSIGGSHQDKPPYKNTAAESWSELITAHLETFKYKFVHFLTYFSVIGLFLAKKTLFFGQPLFLPVGFRSGNKQSVCLSHPSFLSGQETKSRTKPEFQDAKTDPRRGGTVSS
jgi:hypothetical protein